MLVMSGSLLCEEKSQTLKKRKRTKLQENKPPSCTVGLSCQVSKLDERITKPTISKESHLIVHDHRSRNRKVLLFCVDFCDCYTDKELLFHLLSDN